MYGNVHGVTGTIIVLAVYVVSASIPVAIVVGGLLAFLSHDLLDRLGEHSFPTKMRMVVFEGIAMIVFLLAAYLSGLWMLYFVGWVAGNLMDIIDKKGYLSIAFPEKFETAHYFPCHRRRPDIQFTLEQTKLISYISSILILMA